MNVGSAVVDITPPVGVSLAGYFEDRKSKGIHDPLCAHAIVLESPDASVALITCDLIAIDAETVAQTQALIADAIPIAPDHIFIHTTHTHTGPATAGAFGVPQDHFYVGYLPQLLKGCVIAAYHDRRPCKIGFGCGSEKDVAFNRRYLMRDGTVRTNPGAGAKWQDGKTTGNPDIVRPSGPTDLDVGIMRVEDDKGQTRSVLVNYACHVDTVGGDYISADYPGVLRATVRRILGDPTMAAFFNGCCGNINHINFQSWNVKPGYFAHAQWMGTILGTEAARVACKTECDDISILRAGSTSLEIAVRQPAHDELEFARRVSSVGEDKLSEEDRRELERRSNRFGSELAWMRELVYVADEGKKVETVPVGAVRIGDAALVFLSGEVFVEFGLRIKAESPFRPTFVIELTNGGLGYIPTQQAFAEGTGYEERLARSSRLVPEAGDRMVDAALKLLRKLQT